MTKTGRPERVDVYCRRRGVPGERYRYLLSETTSFGNDALKGALEIVEHLRRELPDYEYLLVVVRRAQGNGWRDGA